MHKVTFYPVGNGDTRLINLENGKRLLFDYSNSSGTDNLNIELDEALLEEFDKNEEKSFDVVGFTHGDRDHVSGARDFFYFEHAKMYQSEERVKIKELWVPVAMVVETDEVMSEDLRVIRQEARHRLQKGEGIKIFSRHDRLEKWLLENDLTLDERKHLFISAGEVVPGFTKQSDGIEIFVHSPFYDLEGGEITDRNELSLIFHVTFQISDVETKYFLVGDTTYDVLVDIVNKTIENKNETRLKWDIFDIPHHCSYLALGPEKGTDMTDPDEKVRLLLNQGEKGGILVSSSNIILEKDNDQPPHMQAAKYYRKCADEISGKFKVTMEHPSKERPDRLVIEIDVFGATLKTGTFLTGGAILTQSAPRAGRGKNELF